MFSKSIEYGYMIIIFLKNKKTRMTGREILEKLPIPTYYGLTILKQLSQAKILISSKGQTGGFILDKQRKITFLELFQIMNENDKKMNSLRDKEVFIDENYIKIISELKEKLMKDMEELII